MSLPVIRGDVRRNRVLVVHDYGNNRPSVATDELPLMVRSAAHCRVGVPTTMGVR
jgi:hypothetical protein